MLKIKEYVRAESLEQAYELNRKKTNRIIGGMLWMKMSDARIQTAIDLSALGLDQIEEIANNDNSYCTDRNEDAQQSRFYRFAQHNH